MQPITGIVIALNEEGQIASCIDSLMKVCNEVIVVDSNSKDDTARIAEEKGAKVIIQEYLGDGPQKSFGVSYATNDWILSLDADERLAEDAVVTIKSLSLDNPSVAYSFRRKNFCGPHWIKAAGFYPDEVTRLYNRKTSGYLPKKAHSSVQAPQVRRTSCHILHYTYESLSHWTQRINELSTRDAWAMRERDIKASSFRPALHALSALIRKLLFKGGFLQGSDGITVAITTAFHAYMKYAKLNELYERETEAKDDRKLP